MGYVLEEMGGQIQAARERAGLSQRALAKQAGLTQAQISRIENGTSDARLSTLMELAAALGLELMLVPNAARSTVKAVLQEAEIVAEVDRRLDKVQQDRRRPAYRLDDDDD